MVKFNLLTLLNTFTKGKEGTMFEKPFLFDKMVYATNGLVCIKTDQTLLANLEGVNIDFEKDHKLDPAYLFNKVSNCDLVISTGRLKEIIKQAKEHQKQAHADAEANGRLKRNGDKHYFIKIGEGFYKLADVKLLFETAKFFNLQSFTQTYCAACKEDFNSLFDLGYAKIVTMFVEFSGFMKFSEENPDSNYVLIRY